MSERSLLPLHRLLCSETQSATRFHGAGAPRDTARFAQDVAARAFSLHEREEKRWLLREDDLYAFCCGLFALLHAGKEAVVPPNLQPGTVERLRALDAFDAIYDHAVSTGEPIALKALERDRPALHLYTSGSTGEPKRVPKTLAQLENEIAVFENLWGAQLGDACFLATVPHYHMYGLPFRLLWPLAAGRDIDATQCLDPDVLAARLREFPGGVLVATPAQLSRLPQLWTLSALRPAPRLIFSSGGPLRRDAALAFAASLGAAPTEIYGSTETGAVAWRRQDEGTHWTPLPGLRVQRGVDGALLLQSPFLPDRETLRCEDGIDLLDDGRFLLRGRLDRVIKVEEKRVSLPEAEARLGEHAWIAECALVGLAGTRQYLAAAAVLSGAGRAALEREGRKAVVHALREHLRLDYEAVLLPRRWRFVERLPLNERGKLNSAALERLFDRSADSDAVAAA
jgi:acyl-coenzyme A synthetase/AMP-(fatty) acid ligase